MKQFTMTEKKVVRYTGRCPGVTSSTNGRQSGCRPRSFFDVILTSFSFLSCLCISSLFLSSSILVSLGFSSLTMAMTWCNSSQSWCSSSSGRKYLDQDSAKCFNCNHFDMDNYFVDLFTSSYSSWRANI